MLSGKMIYPTAMKFELMLLTLQSLCSLFRRRLLVIWWWFRTWMLRKPCCNWFEEVPWRPKSCTVALFFEPQSEDILWLIDSDKPSLKTLLSTCSSHTLSHLGLLLHSASTLFAGYSFEGLMYCHDQCPFLQLHLHCICLEKKVDGLEVQVY